VPLGAHAAPAEVTLVAMPERSPCAFTRSRQVNGGRPLLAGPVDLVRDHGQVGRTSVLYVAGGERFELGWGPDPELRLHREEERLREEPGLLQSAKVTRVQVVVRLSNLGATPRTVEVVERVPVSELDKVEIVVTPPEGWSPPTLATERAAGVELVTARSVDGDGLVRWQVTLPPRGRRMVALEYRVRADSGVVGL
jgi:uncharacterized protein (TIGR02231 family)